MSEIRFNGFLIVVMLRGTQTTRRIATTVKESKDAHISTLGEMLGVHKTASPQAKQQRYVRYLKSLAKHLNQLEKIAQYLQKSSAYFLFPKEPSPDYEAQVMGKLAEIDHKLQTALEEFHRKKSLFRE